MSPPHQTGEHPATAPIDEKTPMRLGLVITLCAALLAAGGEAIAAKLGIDQVAARVAQVELRTDRLEADKAAKDVRLQKIDDDLAHLVETVDRIDRNVQHLQGH